MTTDGTTLEAPARLQWVGLGALPSAARDALIGPGAPYEMRIEDVRGCPLEVFVQRSRSLREMFDETVTRHSELPFLVSPDRTWTFAEAAHEIDVWAHLLVDRYGIAPGDRVAIVSANRAEYGLLMWAILSVGGIVTSLNGWWTGPELKYGIELTTPKLIAGDEPRLARLAADSLPAGVPVRRLEALRVEALEIADPNPPAVDIDEDDPAVILFTSGTTGRPKGAILSHRNIINFAMTSRLYSAVGTLVVPSSGRQPASVLASPMFHVSGMIGLLMTGGALGSKLIFPPPGRWEPKAYLELTRQHGISTWSGVPTQFWRLLRHDDLDSYDLRGVLAVGGGGAPFPPELVRALKERMPWVALGNGYGMSETVGLGTRINGDAMVAAPESVGPANIGTEVEIRDPIGDLLSEDEVGEIYLRTACVFLGYWDDPEATRLSLDEQGWYRTGDFGRIRNGMLYLESRMRDLILRGGENIYPIEIENRLIEHPEIDDSAVIGVDHPELGQEVKAFVVRSPGSDLNADAVRKWVAEALARFKVPADVEFRDALPYTETGKVIKHELERESASDADDSADGDDPA